MRPPPPGPSALAAIDDAQLIAAVVAGDEKALKEIIDRHHAVVLRIAMAALRERHRAEEVASDVMIAVWTGAAGFAGRSSLRAWVLGIATFKIRDQLRRHARTSLRQVDVGAAEQVAAAVVEPTALRGRSEHRVLQDCLEALSPVCRQVVHLLYYGELSYREIAAILEVPENRLRQRAFSAMRFLRRCLASKGVEP